MDVRAERKRLEAALAAGNESVRIALGGVLQLYGEHAHAIAVLEPGVAAAQRTGTVRAEVEGLIALGVSRQLLGAPDAGVTYRAAIDRAASLGEADPLLARACWELGSMIREVQLVERAARIWVACAQPAWALRARAFLAKLRGEPARELYLQAFAALDLALSETSPWLIEVLLEAADAFEDADARSLRERAVGIARVTTGPASQRTIDTLWVLAATTRDATVFDAVRESARGDTHAEALVLYAKAAFLDSEDAEQALHVREESLVLREQVLGVESHALIPLVSEIKLGWDELGRSDLAEAFLRRCRDRTPVESWVHRNLTYSIASILSVQHRHEEYAGLWHEFRAKREAACAPGTPGLLEALEVVANELQRIDDAMATASFGVQPQDAFAVQLHDPAESAPRLELDLRTADASSLCAMLDDPSCVELRVIAAYFEGEYPQQASNARAVIDVLAEQPRRLRALALIQQAVATPEGLPWTAGCGHDEPILWSRLPHLAQLHLGGIDLVHSIEHPTLEHLVLDDRPICDAGSWELPGLKALDWALARGDIEFATIDPVWTQPLPALRELTLRASFYDCEGALARPEVRGRIRGLDRLCLPWSALDDDPIDTLLAHVADLRHLSRLLVTDAELGDPRLARLHRELPDLVLVESSGLDRAAIGLGNHPSELR